MSKTIEIKVDIPEGSFCENEKERCFFGYLEGDFCDFYQKDREYCKEVCTWYKLEECK